HVVGPFEGVIVASVCRGAAAEDWPLVLSANEVLWAGLTPLTVRNAGRDLGEQLLALAETWPWATSHVHALRQAAPLATDHWPLTTPQEWHHAPVFATLAAAAGAAPVEAVAVYLHQAALGVIGAGVRAIPIGHTHGQQILARLHDDIYQLAEELAERDL